MFELLRRVQEERARRKKARRDREDDDDQGGPGPSAFAVQIPAWFGGFRAPPTPAMA